MRTEEEWMALRTENAKLQVELAAFLERERVAQELIAQLSERLNKLEERMPSVVFMTIFPLCVNGECVCSLRWSPSFWVILFSPIILLGSYNP